jgi:hypothetical protein
LIGGLLLSLLALYVLSWGPVCWLIWSGHLPAETDSTVRTLYRPIGWLVEHGPTALRRALLWYLSFWHPA